MVEDDAVDKEDYAEGTAYPPTSPPGTQDIEVGSRRGSSSPSSHGHARVETLAQTHTLAHSPRAAQGHGEEVGLEDDDDDKVPDGGYGWVVVACLVAMNASTWGESFGHGQISRATMWSREHATCSSCPYAVLSFDGSHFIESG